MSASWKMIALAPRQRIEAALLAHEDAVEWDPEIVLGGSEVAEDRPDEWQLEAWLPRRPTKPDIAAVAALFGSNPPAVAVEQLPETDWVTASQQSLAPIREGPFHVHAPEVPRDPDAIDFVIPASRAFGTGQHATTAGCLAMLATMKARGVIVRNLIDVGTGTGLLAFAAQALWPRAIATASDIDAVCADVVLENAGYNGIQTGPRRGELTVVIAPGLDHPLIAARGPYDLIAANILAGPLIELAPDFARAIVPGGNLLLAGLLTTQERAVRQAMFRAGFRLAQRLERGDWSILWLRRRAAR
jgi:ribosomal protein L11 methyltransferase